MSETTMAATLTRRSVLAGGASALALGRAAAQASTDAQKLKAVASMSIIGDLAANVGGDRVTVTALVGPNGDPHVYSPSPGDARKLAGAAIVFVNGLGLEGWMTRLAAAAAGAVPVVILTNGVAPRTTTSDDPPSRTALDPHAWQSVANAKIYVANIREGLNAADPAGKAVYAANAATYLAKLDALEQDVKAAIAAIPPDRRKIITTHDAFGYFGAAYGMSFMASEGVATEAEPSAKDVARIIAQIKRQKIPAVFLENVADPRLMRQIARETGAHIGGTLYSDALSEPGGPAATYIDMMRHNVSELTKALTG